MTTEVGSVKITGQSDAGKDIAADLNKALHSLDDLKEKGQAAANTFAKSMTLTSKEASALGRVVGLTAGEVRKMVAAEKLGAEEARRLAQAQIEAEKSGRSLGQAANDTANGVGKLAAGMQATVVALGAMGLALGAREIVETSIELLKLGAAAERAEFSLNALSDGDADEYVTAIQDASLGTIDAMQAMAISNRALQMGLVDNAGDMARLTEVAVALGRTMGTDSVTAFNDLTTAGARQSRMIADNLGIIIDANALEKEKLRLMEADASLTEDAARQQAFLNQMIEQGSGTLEKMGGLQQDNATALEQVNALWADFKGVVGEFINLGSAHQLELLSVNIGLVRHAAEGLPEVLDDSADKLLSVGKAAAALGLIPKEAVQLLRNEIIRTREDINRFDDEVTTTADTTTEAAMSAEEYAEALREMEKAARESLRQQESLSKIAVDLAGNYDYLGKTIIRVSEPTAELSDRTAELTDRIEQEQQRLQDAQITLEAFGDGEGALAEEIANATFNMERYNQMLGETAAGHSEVTTAITMTKLTQEDLMEVGEGFIDFLKATGNELLLLGQSGDDVSLKYGLMTERQIAVRDTMMELDAALANGNITLERASQLWDMIITGQEGAAQAAIHAADANVNLSDGLSQVEDKIMQTAAQSRNASEEQQVSVDEVTEKIELQQEQIAEIGTAFEDTTSVIAGAMPRVMGAIEPFGEALDLYSTFFKNAPVQSKVAFDGIALAMQSNWEVIGTTAGMIDGMADNWRYLQANPNLTLNIKVNQDGEIPAAAGGADFVTDGPMLLMVGDNPGGKERVHVTPLSGTGQSHGIPGGMAMGGGSAPVANSGGGDYIDYGPKFIYPQMAMPNISELVTAIQEAFPA